MSVQIEKYRNCERFNEQYQEIYRFLLKAGRQKHNEHFHWGRFEWMHRHSYLDKEHLPSILLFRDDHGEVAGLTTYDTSYEDRTYLIHTASDRKFLQEMIDSVVQREKGRAVIKANAEDTALCEALRENGFQCMQRENKVLVLDLKEKMEYCIPDDYLISQPGFAVDDWKYQLVIHKGFGNEEPPEKWSEEVLAPTPHENMELKLFALRDDEYCAHCGLWYSEGDSAYVEPVVTVPKHRNQGLARAVIYEACQRAVRLGAQRALVLSEQAFYEKIGFRCSSEVYRWEMQSGKG